MLRMREMRRKLKRMRKVIMTRAMRRMTARMKKMMMTMRMLFRYVFSRIE